MPTTDTCTTTRTSTTAPPVTRDRDTLLQLLDVIDTEGWDGPTGTRLLDYVRHTVVRPLVVDVGLRGAAASQAEASGWQEVWVTLTSPTLRSAASPWGVIWKVARRTVLHEIVCARFATNPRRAWEMNNALAAPTARAPVSLDALARRGWEPEAPPDDPHRSTRMPDVVRTVRDALVMVGWPADESERIIEDVLTDEVSTRGARWIAYGWRDMAQRLDIPAWQARRLVLVLRGSAERPGLLPRLLLSSGRPQLGPAIRGALLSTRHRARPSPVLDPLPGGDDVVTSHPQQAVC
jgi:hypothetical protein